MKRTLSRFLWLAAAGSIALGGCSSKSSSDNVSTTEGRNVAKVDQKLNADQAGSPSAKPMPGKESKKRVTATIGGKAKGASGMAMPRIAPQPPIKRPPTPPDTAKNTEDYKDYGTNPMTDTAKDRLSTFAVDVDTASYAIARRKINSGMLPPGSSIRVEEWLNYFKYEYAGPQKKGMPFAVHMDAAPSPFTKGRHLLRVGVQAKKLSRSERKNANLVFLVDVSGSMHSPDKLDLAKRALRILVHNLKDGDSVSLVTYAGNTKVVLPATGLDNKGRIMSAIEDLSAGGSTAMASGLDLAYKEAAKNLKPNTISRVLVLSDGDANVGRTGHDAILRSISKHVKEGVTLSTIGFGMGNYKDTRMEQLANKGNGNYYYIDTLSQAKRTFQEQLGGTLQVVAKDVKLQVEFDPKVVKRYRLVGYENRDIADRDFRNDRVDAGEIGAGHTVTALYEVELAKSLPASLDSLATVRIRHKKPRGSKATENAYQFSAKALASSFGKASQDFRFAAAVSAAAEVLRGSKHAANWDLGRIIAIADSTAGDSAERKELVSLLKKAKSLKDKMAAR
jgi:Ca-activated chloride channel family protein